MTPAAVVFISGAPDRRLGHPLTTWRMTALAISTVGMATGPAWRVRLDIRESGCPAGNVALHGMIKVAGGTAAAGHSNGWPQGPRRAEPCPGERIPRRQCRKEHDGEKDSDGGTGAARSLGASRAPDTRARAGARR